MTSPPTISVLDLIPVRTGQSTGDALRASLALAGVAERLGVHRYWVAEHHNMPAVASTNPPVLIAMFAAATSTMRIGSGGVMLPNHAPLVVAEQFALLEAAHPGRIDLGIGRAPGSDPVTNWALRHGGPETADPERFSEHVTNLVAMLEPAGVGLQLQGRTYPLRATPEAVGTPAVWLLGSSDYSARLAATLGLPYVFAHHFSGSGTAEALELYRENFSPSGFGDEPRTFLTVNVAVAETREEALELARPQLLAMISLRTGGPLGPQPSVEESLARPLPVEHEGLATSMLSRWVVDEPVAAAERIRELASVFAVDEVMVHPIAGARAGDPADRAPARERTLELLVDALR
ncbi:LLM class flavin-dependent oxidoreductase [Microlunatus ginsengisoli]|uniref:LLM class flavin-dependent oxidoreductase n=1 Tax=Microlunatus ginsengisoli TaxID=363863 RepID=A0ABP6ZR76_9ACTN